MNIFLQQIIEGLASGGIYASLAIALTLIHRSTGIANFAQGEMAMFSTYVAWQLLAWGFPLWASIGATLVFAFAFGAIIEYVIMRRIEGSSLLTMLMVTFGAYLVINNGAGFIWSYNTKSFPGVFSDDVMDLGVVRVRFQVIGILGVLIIEAAALWMIFKHTRLGLAMRAATSNVQSSRLVGIDVELTYILGWGMASCLGAVCGILVAPNTFLEPGMMGGVLIYAFAAAALGGINSPLGAIIGSIILGVTEAIAGTFVPMIGSDLKILVPLSIIILTLLVRPNGLFGKTSAVRV